MQQQKAAHSSRVQPINTPLLSLTNVGIRRHHRWLVHSLTFDIFRGEIITLIGPNGAGKTTTAKMLLGILSPTTGKIWRQNPLKIAYVPQQFQIDPALPLDVMRLMTLTGPIAPDIIEQTLKDTAVYHLRHSPVFHLSGGELQRVLLARAMARRADLLILDEPLQAIDFSSEHQLYRAIAEYRDRFHCAIVLISHDLHIVMAASDRVLCLNGQICCSGKPEEVIASKEYTALFGNFEQPNLALYRHHHDHLHPNKEKE